MVSALIDPDPAKRPGCDELLARLTPPVARARPAARPRLEPAGATVFVGRSEELGRLRRAFAATADGRAAMVRVHGTSGIGKSALIERFLGGLEDERTVLVLRARCHPQETIPFKAVDGLIDQLSRYLTRQMTGQLAVLMPRHVDALVRLFPVLGRVPFPAAASRGTSPPEEEPHIVRRRAEMALRDLLGRLADRVPLVLWVDDVQWGDTDSAALLRAVLRPPDPPPVLVLLSYRSENRGSNPLLRAIEAEQLGADLELERDLTIGPLASDDARTLADRLLSQAGIHSQRAVLTVTAESHGSPFFISQLAHTLIATHDSAPSEGGHLRVEHVVRHRLSHLSDAERRLLSIVSVSNGSIDRRLAWTRRGSARRGTTSSRSSCTSACCASRRWTTRSSSSCTTIASARRCCPRSTPPSAPPATVPWRGCSRRTAPTRRMCSRITCTAPASWRKPRPTPRPPVTRRRWPSPSRRQRSCIVWRSTGAHAMPSRRGR